MPRTHKKLQRLYVSAKLAPDMTLDLDKAQANYLGNVLRAKPGVQLVVFNGRDGAWLAELAEISRKSASVRLLEQSVPQPPAHDLWYGFAPLKSARLDYMVQKATEMGASTLQPVITRHTQVSRIKMDRMKANTIEAAEQCEVLQVPDVWDEITIDDLVQTWPQQHPDRMLIVADEDANSASPADSLAILQGQKIGLLIGPEGGFADEERALLKSQDFVFPISLGPRILRADTAAVAALAVTQSIIGDWR